MIKNHLDTDEHSGHKRRLFKSRGAAWLCAALAAGAAHAESSPYTIGAGITFGRDNNLFRAPAGETVSDRYTVLSVFGGVDETIGRQHVQAKGTLRRSDYQKRDDLDNTGYGVLLGWNGATANEVSWNLSYNANRSLASYATVLEAERRIPNIETSQQARADLQVGMRAQWIATMMLSHRSIDYSAAAYADDQYRLDTVGFGATWNPLGPVSISVGPRFGRGRYPQARAATGGGFEADDFTRRDLDLGVKWVATGASTLTARLSATRQRFDLLGDRDFDGATGELRWLWQATGKTKLNTVLTRDTGSETGFFDLSFLGDQQRGTGDNSQVTNSIATRIDHELTGKTALSLSLQYALRRLVASSRLDDGSLFFNAGGIERSASAVFGLRYTPTRNSVLGCDVGYYRRGTRTILSTPYHANTFSCSAQLAIN